MPREPYNTEYCLAVNCKWFIRRLQKCAHKYCKRLGNEKRAMYFTRYGRLALGDIPEVHLEEIEEIEE